MNEGGRALQVRPIDPVSLGDLPDRPPVGLGHHYTHSLSPDGRTLAAMVYSSGSPLARGGQLHLLKLTSWTALKTEVTVDDNISALTFNADGKALYWTKAARRDLAHGTPRDHELYRYQLSSGELKVVARLPSSFIPWETRLTGSGRNPALFGVPHGADGLSEDSPQVLIVELASGRTAADVRLNGARAGQIRVEAAERGGPCCHIYRPGLAWDLNEDRLYVVHADEDKVTVIDLSRGKILRRSDIRPRLSFLEGVGDWLVPGVEAKLVPGTHRLAVLSASGDRLYILSLRQEMAKESDGMWSWREVPLGLQVISTNNLSQRANLDLPVSNLALSPDGKRLLLVGSFENFSFGHGVQGAGSKYENHGLYVLDADRLEQIAHLEPEVAFSLFGFSADSRYAYVSQPASKEPGHGDQSRVLRVLDLDSHRFVAEREGTAFGLLPVLTLQR